MRQGSNNGCGLANGAEAARGSCLRSCPWIAEVWVAHCIRASFCNRLDRQ